MRLKECVRTLKNTLKKYFYFVINKQYVTIDGIKIKIYDFFTTKIKHEIFSKNYEKRELNILKRTLDESDILLEIGGGIGFISSYASKFIPSRNIYVVEANPKLIPLIKETYELNNIYPHPNIFNLILSNENGEQTFYIHKNFYSSSIIPRSGFIEKISIKKKNVNEFIQTIKPTYLVIDIEGGEKELIKSMDFNKHKYIKKIQIEVHPHIISNCDISEIFYYLFDYSFCCDYTISKENVFYFKRYTH